MFYDATVLSSNLFSIKIPSNARRLPTPRFNIVFILSQKIFECLLHLSAEHYLHFHSDEGFIYGISEIENATNVKHIFDPSSVGKETIYYA